MTTLAEIVLTQTQAGPTPSLGFPLDPAILIGVMMIVFIAHNHLRPLPLVKPE